VGSRSSALHFIRLALLVLTLLETCALVAIPVAKATACLWIALAHCICLQNSVKVNLCIVVLVEVMSIGLTIDLMSGCI